MSQEAVQAIIGKAVLDSEFRQALFADPVAALEGYDLTEQEVATLKGIDSETMESLAGTLDERISKAVIAFGAGGSSASGLEPDLPLEGSGMQPYP
jgi:hypothetical protein